jgi:D-alanyl-D-alanine carboxypeptidase (penicillin-binding protein 5/6)
MAAVLLPAALCVMIFARASVPTPEVPTTEVTVSTIATTAPVETIEPETLPAVVVQPVRSRPEPDPNYQLTARHAFVYDCNSDTLRFSLGNMDDQIAPASLTKLLTAYVALQYLDPADIVVCGEETRWIDPASSVAWVGPGDRVPVELLIQGMLMQSGNDAAYATAVAAGRVIARDPQRAPREALAIFMEEVNVFAQELGLTGTNFETPDGLDTWKHYTTPRDMLTIALLVMEQPLLRHYTGIATANVMYENGETYVYRSTNYLLQPESQYYCADACGMKTGTTKKAGSCLMSLFHNGEGYVLIGIFGCPRYEDRFADALQLYALYGAPGE